MKILLNNKDKHLVDMVKGAIRKAYESAAEPPAVAKSIASYATRFRNKGRERAIKSHPFKGICEASGRPLADEDKCLDELEQKGYYGKVRWICPVANNSGRKSCGGCKK